VKQVAVVGAGPAGLVLANALVRRLPPIAPRIVMLDSGPDVATRQALFTSGSSATVPHIINGSGGAGLFSDGKLSIANVGNELPLSKPEFHAKLRELMAILGEYVPAQKLRQDEVATPPIDLLERHGLRLRVTPTIHLGTDGAFSLTQRLEGRLRASGVELRFGETVQSITVLDAGGFMLNTDRDAHQVRALVLATGKAGSAFMNRVMGSLRIPRAVKKFSLGLRVETHAQDLAGLRRFGLNPKIYREETTPGIIATKTFCICHGGVLQPYSWNGIPLVGGHSFSDRSGPLSNLAILSEIRADAFPGLARDLGEHHWSQPLVQSAGGFLAASEEPFTGLDTSLPRWLPFPVHTVYPKPIYAALKSFLVDLTAWDDDIRLDRALVAAIGMEEVSPKIVVDGNLETAIRNLFVVGDGSGLTEGIVPAMISGLMGARALTERFGS
jgi:uncharacterized FAD-dependent dehydrogenase